MEIDAQEVRGGRLSPRRVDRVDPVGPEMPTSQVDKRRDVLTLGPPRLTDPFIMLSEDWFSRVGFDWHPHRGFETVTYVVGGELEHRDNAGGHGILGPGDLQWVTTGRGVMHAELAHQQRPVHTLQLWLNLPRVHKLAAPRYQNLRGADVPVVKAPGVEARVFAGELRGVRGPAETLWPTTVLDVRMAMTGRFVVELPGEQAAFLYVLAGAVNAGADRARVAAGEVAWFGAGPRGATALELVAEGPARLLLYASAPIGEPMVSYGPFVMTSREEIIEAVRAYERGEFGPVPA